MYVLHCKKKCILYSIDWISHFKDTSCWTGLFFISAFPFFDEKIFDKRLDRTGALPFHSITFYFLRALLVFLLDFLVTALTGRKSNVYKAVFLLGAVSVGFPSDSVVKNLPSNAGDPQETWV